MDISKERPTIKIGNDTILKESVDHSDSVLLDIYIQNHGVQRTIEYLRTTGSWEEKPSQNESVMIFVKTK